MTETTYDDEARTANLSGGQLIRAFHKSTMCAGESCPVHNPSDHEYRDLPLFYDGIGGYMYRMTENGTKILDPNDYRLRTYGSVIVRNSGECLLCGTGVFSAFRHDSDTCECGNVTVDGGKVYLKRSVREHLSSFEETSIVCTPDNLVIE